VEDYKLTPDPALFEDLCQLIETLRGPRGCPWDRQQIPRSIVRYLTEEVYELTDAVAAADIDAAGEEVGDVLFLTLFLVQLYREENQFGLDHVVNGVKTKMIRRHPHVFDGLEVEDSAEVSRNWTRIKKAEKRSAGDASALDGIPRATPSLSRAYRISEAAAAAGFDARSPEDLWRQCERAMDQLRRIDPASAAPQLWQIAMGRLLWRLVAFGRSKGVTSEAVLSETLDQIEKKLRELEANEGVPGTDPFEKGTGLFDP
jgi:MazG family protein